MLALRPHAGTGDVADAAAPSTTSAYGWSTPFKVSPQHIVQATVVVGCALAASTAAHGDTSSSATTAAHRFYAIAVDPPSPDADDDDDASSSDRHDVFASPLTPVPLSALAGIAARNARADHVVVICAPVLIENVLVCSVGACDRNHGSVLCVGVRRAVHAVARGTRCATHKARRPRRRRDVGERRRGARVRVVAGTLCVCAVLW
jgi:hypothetical protein